MFERMATQDRVGATKTMIAGNGHPGQEFW